MGKRAAAAIHVDAEILGHGELADAGQKLAVHEPQALLALLDAREVALEDHGALEVLGGGRERLAGLLDTGFGLPVKQLLLRCFFLL